MKSFFFNIVLVAKITPVIAATQCLSLCSWIPLLTDDWRLCGAFWLIFSPHTAFGIIGPFRSPQYPSFVSAVLIFWWLVELELFHVCTPATFSSTQLPCLWCPLDYFNAATDFGMLRLLSDRWPRCSCGVWVERQHMFWHRLCRVGKYKVPSQKDFVINIWFLNCWFISFFKIIFENCAHFVQDKCVLVRTEVGDYSLMYLKQVYPKRHGRLIILYSTDTHHIIHCSPWGSFQNKTLTFKHTLGQRYQAAALQLLPNYKSHDALQGWQ